MEVDEASKDKDNEAELVLFAAPASSAPQSQRIRLQSPETDVNGGFIIPRPRSYYFATQNDAGKQSQLEMSAIDAGTIRAIAKEPWLGCALPWKVKRISAAGIKKCVLVPHRNVDGTFDATAHKRARKGKKSRIALRTQLKARAEKQAEEERLKREKEEAEKEKKTRRNREKKLKKKAKNKAKKLAEDVGDTGPTAEVELKMPFGDGSNITKNEAEL
jgi:hypothetical protein